MNSALLSLFGRRCWAVLLMLLLACAVTTQAAPKVLQDPIDLWLDKALKKETATAGMRNVTNLAREMWEKEMNLSYQHLQTCLNPTQQAALQAAQQAWQEFREHEGQVLGKMFASEGGELGSIGQLTATSLGMELVKARTQQLRGYEKQLGTDGCPTRKKVTSAGKCSMKLMALYSLGAQASGVRHATCCMTINRNHWRRVILKRRIMLEGRPNAAEHPRRMLLGLYEVSDALRF